MADRKEDWHSLQHYYQYGTQIEKDTKEKEKHFEQLLSKIPKIANYFSIRRNIQTSPNGVPSLTSDHNDNSSSSTTPSECKIHVSPSTSNTHYIPATLLLDFDTATEIGEEYFSGNYLNYIDWLRCITQESELPKRHWSLGKIFTDDEIDYWMRKGSTDLQQRNDKILSR